MNEPGTANTAETGSYVGIQADHVHNSNVYQVLPGDPPSRSYEVGKQYLEIGVPRSARKLIEDAIARGYTGGEVRFHLVLAMLSKRAYHDLGSEDRRQLDRVKEESHTGPDSEWKSALEAVFELLGCLAESGDNPDPALKRLRALPPDQYFKVIRHLDLVLTGGMKESLWAENRQAAKDTRTSGDRTDRVWAYFEPDPAGARGRRPAPNSTTLADYLKAAAWSGAGMVAIGHLGWAVLVRLDPIAILAYVLALAAGSIAVRKGSVWRFKTRRLLKKEREHSVPQRSASAPEDGFADGVDRSFTHYFIKYAPEDVSRPKWLAETEAERRILRDELVEIYREKRIGVDNVKWLIRYLVRDTKKQWTSGALKSYRDRYRVDASTKARCVLALLALLVSAVGVASAAVQEAPFTATLAVLAALVSLRFAAPLWLGIDGERRRLDEELQDYERIRKEREAEHRRWKSKVDSARPSESEMEAWLNADKTIILGTALHHCRLAWHSVIAHAFLQTRGQRCKRARTDYGPWRYSKYEIRVFLVTEKGLREFVADLDFEKAEVTSYRREHFRFEAVSSVKVEVDSALSHTLHITLMNGSPKKIEVTDPTPQKLDSDEEPGELSELNLDASGFGHTLRILEGIAAEGGAWIDQNRSLADHDRFSSAEQQPGTPHGAPPKDADPEPSE